MAAATIVYQNPAAAPSGFNQSNTVVATVQPASTADTAQITHAFGLSAADLALGFPTISITPLTVNASGSNWNITSIAANYIGLVKNNSTQSSDSVPQIQVVITRPSTIVR